MLNRHVEGEPEEFARLRGKIVTLCDIAHFNKVMSILKADAKKEGITMQMALYVWEKNGCIDCTIENGRIFLEKKFKEFLTTKSGWREYVRVYNYEMSIEH